MIFSLLLAIAGGPGTDVKLHVTDAHGKPLANQEVWLQPTNSTKPIRPFGIQWGTPDNNRYMHGFTDANGNVIIQKAKWRTPLMVITRFGPRFNSYVDKQHLHDPAGAVEHQDMDVMKMEGAVYAGGSAHIVIANDYRIVGRVTDFETGKPVPNVPIYLDDTSFGHMGGYPLTELDDTKTDASGSFVFSHLPNCQFTIFLWMKPTYGLEGREDHGKWDALGVNRPGFNGAIGEMLLLNKPVVKCDFRLSEPAELTVIVDMHGRSAADWVVATAEDGQGLSNGTTFKTFCLPGPQRIVFTRESDGKEYLARSVRLKAGEKRTVRVRLPGR
jgi:hypothetical protein